jgi:hypothetical protein
MESFVQGGHPVLKPLPAGLQSVVEPFVSPLVFLGVFLLQFPVIFVPPFMAFLQPGEEFLVESFPPVVPSCVSLLLFMVTVIVAVVNAWFLVIVPANHWVWNGWVWGFYRWADSTIGVPGIGVPWRIIVGALFL